MRCPTPARPLVALPLLMALFLVACSPPTLANGGSTFVTSVAATPSTLPTGGIPLAAARISPSSPRSGPYGARDWRNRDLQ